MADKPRDEGQRKPLSTVLASSGSYPWMALKMNAQSSTLRASGPTLSMLQARAMHPARLTRPKVGRRPVVPQRVLGETMLPSVSVPSAKPTSPAEVADAAPAEEPLEPCLM